MNWNKVISGLLKEVRELNEDKDLPLELKLATMTAVKVLLALACALNEGLKNEGYTDPRIVPSDDAAVGDGKAMGL